MRREWNQFMENILATTFQLMVNPEKSRANVDAPVPQDLNWT